MRISIFFCNFAVDFCENRHFMTNNITPPAKAFAQSRQSNIELLRLVYMFFIVLQHVIKSAIYPEVQTDGTWTSGSYMGALSLGIVCVGVNCFILISGFFGIKFKLRSLFNLYAICAFYNLIAYGVHIGLDDASIGRSLILNTLFPFSHSTWWFINCYVQLFFFAPLINFAIDNTNRHQHLGIIALLTITNIYLGHFWQTELFDKIGMSTLHFIYIYIIGRYLGKYASAHTIDCNRHKWLALFLGCALCAGIGKGLEHLAIIPNWMGLSNNSPLMIGSAIGLLLYANSFHFNCKFINTVAISTLAIYLGHEHEYINDHIYNYISSLQTRLLSPEMLWDDLLGRIMLAIGCSLIICVVILIFDRLRLLLMKPIWKIYDKIEPRIMRLISRV